MSDGQFTSFPIEYLHSANPNDMQGDLVNLEEDVAVLTGRMDEFASLPDGSTAGDAELLDIRVGWTGTTYTSAGNAVRGQASVAMQYHNGASLTDVNSMTYPGFYGVGYSQELSNDPIGKNKRRLFIVYSPRGGVASDYIMQKAVNILTGETYYRFRASGTWYSWVSENDFVIGQVLAPRSITNLTDFNNAKDGGCYIMAYGGTYSNDPIGTNNRRILCVYPTSDKTIIYQNVTNPDTLISYWRYYSNSTWSAWVTENRTAYYKQQDVTGITDMNNATQNGTYILAYATTYANEPIGPNTRRILRNYRAANNYFVQEITNFETGVTYWRYYAGGSWYPWVNADDAKTDNISGDFSGGQSFVTTAVTGKKLKIVSYNVANYNNDTQTYLPSAKQFNLKSMLSELDADIIGVQEDRNYIDSSNTKETGSELYNPILPKVVGNGGVKVRSKVDPASTGSVQYTSGRYIRYAVFDIDGDSLLFLSTHPSPGFDATAEATRLQEYTELFKWIYGEIQLSSTSAPTWDYCIIAGDMNSATATDRSNLATLASARNFTMANGGYLGWLVTCYYQGNGLCLDNIICSENITISNIKAYTSKYGDLYSDHVPLSAEVTLL